MWDLIVSVPDHCLSFYFLLFEILVFNLALNFNRAGSHFLSKHCFYFHWNILIQKNMISLDFILYHVLYFNISRTGSHWNFYSISCTRSIRLRSTEKDLDWIFIQYHVS